MRIFQILVITAVLFVLNCSDDKNTESELAKTSNLAIPRYICKKISKSLNLTGKLDDPGWNKVESIFLVDAIHGGKGRFKTEVRVLYDDRFLYVGFRCEDDYIWGTVTERDGEIWNQECVEVFLNPANAGHQYYEINVSPKNIIYDSVILNNRTQKQPFAKFIGFPEWNAAEMSTSVFAAGELDLPGGGRGWTAEFAIPFNVLFGAANIPPKSGDVWRAGFFRIDSPQQGQREHYVWVKTGREAFHLPWLFGYLEFE